MTTQQVWAADGPSSSAVSWQKDTVLAERDLLVVVVIKLEAVEADVVRVSPRR